MSCVPCGHVIFFLALALTDALRIADQYIEPDNYEQHVDAAWDSTWTPSFFDDDDSLSDQHLHDVVKKWANLANNQHAILSKDGRKPHPAKAMHDKPVWFIHLHQNGGTFMRMAAEFFSEKPLSPHSPNWNHESGEDMCTHPMPCHQKYELMIRQGATYTATERSFLSSVEHCPDQFIYALAMSNPKNYVHRSLDHLKFQQKAVDELISILKGIPDKENGLFDKCWAESSKKPQGGQYAQYDNFIIRNLLGHEVFWLPPGNITQNHLEQAKEIIQKFDIILLTEEMKEHFIQLEQSLGWSTDTLNHMGHYNHRHTGLKFDQEQTEFLSNLNRWDQQLYEFVVPIARRKSHR